MNGEERKRRKRRRRKSFILRFARAYKKAPWAVRLQVAAFFLLILTAITVIVICIAKLFSGGENTSPGLPDLPVETPFAMDTGIGETMVIPSYSAKVTDKVRSYEDIIEEQTKKYKIYKYRELVLAMIQQESDGEEPDVMQAEQCGYNHYPPIGGAEESIICGVQELRDCLRLAEVRGPSDIERIKLAIQGYNYGQGYIRQTRRNGEGYTAENARDFSEMMKRKLDIEIYGDPEYVPHVLRYYKKSKNKDKSGHSNE